MKWPHLLEYNILVDQLRDQVELLINDEGVELPLGDLWLHKVSLCLDEKILCGKWPAHLNARLECLVEYLSQLVPNELVLLLPVVLVSADLLEVLAEPSVKAIRVIIVVHLSVLVGLYEVFQLLFVLLVGIDVPVAVGVHEV